MPAPTPPRFIPSWEFHEAHRSRPIRANSADIIEAVVALDMRGDPVTDFLLKVRELPGRLRRRTAPDMPPFGLHAFTILYRDEHEVCLGMIGRFWRLDFGLVPIKGADEFMAHGDPNHAKLVIRFRAVETGIAGYRLETETFVHCPSRMVKFLFTPYWLVIRLASGWIRKRGLAAIERSFT